MNEIARYKASWHFCDFLEGLWWQAQEYFLYLYVGPGIKDDASTTRLIQKVYCDQYGSVNLVASLPLLFATFSPVFIIVITEIRSAAVCE